MSEKRTLVIGDMHGALRAFKQCLERAEVSTDDTLIFLGDYVDGWSESGQLIDCLIDLNKTQECIFIKGNHDVMCCNYLEGIPHSSSWLNYGGDATIECYTKHNFNHPEHINFFENLLNYYIDEQNNLFIHAGFTSTKGPQKETDPSYCYWDRTLWETALSFDQSIPYDDVRYPKRFKQFKEIFIGHTATLKYGKEKPMNLLNLWNMDTGAAYTGSLTIMDTNTKQIWQSDAVNELYPDEKGRN